MMEMELNSANFPLAIGSCYDLLVSRSFFLPITLGFGWIKFTDPEIINSSSGHKNT